MSPTEQKTIPGAQRPPLWRPVSIPAWPRRALVEPPPEGGAPVPVTHITRAPDVLNFSGIAGGVPQPSQAFSVTNTGEPGRLVISVSDDAPWLIVSPVTSTAPSVLTVTADPGSLGVGSYVGAIRIDGAGSDNTPQFVTVNFSVVLAFSPVLVRSPSSLSFSKVGGASDPPSKAINITNSGTGPLNWTASANQSWITLDHASGTAPDTINVSVAQGLLPPSTVNGTITIVSSDAVSGSPQTVPVTFQIAGTFSTLDVDPDSLHFEKFDGGADPATQTLLVRDTSVPDLQVTPGSLTFSKDDGGSDPASQNLNVIDLSA